MAKKVIFVDDSATVLMSVDMATEELVSNGTIEVETYSNPEILLEDIKNGKDYDLLVTDINMPQLSGFELAIEVKKINKTKPIIALTTENTSDMKMKGKEAGIIGWITKPFSEGKVIMAIKRVLRIR